MQPVIDVHVHITSPSIIEDPGAYRARDPYFDLLCSSPKNRFVTAEELIEEMDRSGVDRSVVFGFGFRDMDLCREANDYTMEAVAAYPERLIGFATVNPQGPGVVEELERSRAGGLSGVGEIMATGQEADLADKKEMEPLCRFCAENNWPLLVHLNEAVGHYYPGKTGDSIVKGAALAENFPETTFIFAHLGGGLCFYENMPEIRKNLKNVFYDIAAVPFLYEDRIYEVLIASGLGDKILLGSDYPLISPLRYRNTLEKSSLTGEEKTRISGLNFLKLMKQPGV